MHAQRLAMEEMNAAREEAERYAFPLPFRIPAPVPPALSLSLRRRCAAAPAACHLQPDELLRSALHKLRPTVCAVSRRAPIVDEADGDDHGPRPNRI